MFSWRYYKVEIDRITILYNLCSWGFKLNFAFRCSTIVIVCQLTDIFKDTSL